MQVLNKIIQYRNLVHFLFFLRCGNNKENLLNQINVDIWFFSISGVQSQCCTKTLSAYFSSVLLESATFMSGMSTIALHEFLLNDGIYMLYFLQDF